MWEDLSLTRLREIARHYNKTVKIAGIAKLKKEEVIAELKKHLVLATDNKSVKHRTDKSDILLLKEGEPKITAEYKATGKGKEYSKEDPKKAVKAELADLERKSADKKRIKAQAEGAKKDKEAIKPPTVAEATDFVIKKKIKPKKKEIPAPPEQPKKAMEDKSYKKKVVAKKVVQARGASADAMAIKPPEMKKEETSTKKTYPTLIDERLSEAEKLLEKIKKEVEIIDEKKQTGYKLGVDDKKWNKIRDKFEEELINLKKVGRDKTGNIYFKEMSQYFQDKYGDGWKLFHPTASKDKYWNVIDKLIAIWDKAEKLLETKTIWVKGETKSADKGAEAPEMKKEETSKISKELEQLKQDLMSDKADEKKSKNSGTTLVLDYEYKLIDMGYEDKYKNKTPAEELMRKTLLEYIKLTAPQRRANQTAKDYKANGDGYYLYVNMSKKEKEDILKNEKNIDFKKYYKEAKDRVESGDLLNKNTLPQELTSKILKEATQNTKRSNKWEEFYRESKYTRGDNLVELMNKTLDRYFTAKYKNLKETGDLKIYLDNQKSMVLESGILPPSIATELNEKFKDANSQLDQSREVDLDGDKFTSYKNVKEKNSDIRSINKKILSNFKNLNKLKLLKEK
jgi:hypothetical protein